MSNKFKVLVLLPILSVVLTACTVADLPVVGPILSTVIPGGSSGPVTLNVWGLWEDPAVMATMVQKYNEQNPDVTINYEDRSIMKIADYKERVFSRTSDESAQIDVMMVHNSWIPRIAQNLAPAPGEVIDGSTFSQRFYPAATKSAVLNGNVYGTPTYYDGLVLVYNKKHFEEVGQQFPPTAWEEFRRLALELTVRGGDGGRDLVRGGAAIGAADNIAHFSDILGLMWSQAGVAIPSAIDSKPAYDALSYYTNFVKEDKIWNDSMPESTAAFVNGKASMIFVPTWQLLDVLEAMPNIEDIGVAPVPQAIEEDPVTWGSFWMWAVPTSSTNSEAAWDFINFLAQDEQQLMYYNEASKVRPFGPPYSSVSLAPQLTNPLLKPVLDTAPFSNSAEIASRAGNRRQVTALQKAINDVLGGRSSSQEALEEAKEEINR